MSAPSALHLSASRVFVASRQKALNAGVLIALHLLARADRRADSSESALSSSDDIGLFETCVEAKRIGFSHNWNDSSDCQGLPQYGRTVTMNAIQTRQDDCLGPSEIGGG